MRCTISYWLENKQRHTCSTWASIALYWWPQQTPVHLGKRLQKAPRKRCRINEPVSRVPAAAMAARAAGPAIAARSPGRPA